MSKINVHYIKTPTSVIKGGKTSNVMLTWNASFGSKRSINFNNAQMFVDATALSLCDPLVPLDSGTLKKSGVLFTVVGSGQIIYKTPYARKMYYNPQFKFTGSPMRGAYWFERMKKSGGMQTLLQGARKVAEAK